MNDAKTIPAFEGRPVDGTLVKMSGAAPMDEALDGVVLGVDDMVQMTCMFKVVGVFHKVDDKTGSLIRVQIVRPVEMDLTPIDPKDPNDDGVIRAIPYAIAAPAVANGGQQPAAIAAP